MRASPLSITELNEYVRRSLAGDPMLQGIAIQGEISNFKQHTSGHLYFTLKDENSRLSCVMFRQYAQYLRFVPKDGMRIVLSGSVGLYTVAGTYQFYGEAMAADGSGALYELYLKTKEALQKEGLFDAALKKPLPLLPSGVGIVTAKGGAVLRDIMTVSNRRFPGMPLYLRSVQVQGAGAAEDLSQALLEIASLPEVEVIIIGRGGGSLEDLWAFNEEILVRAVAACEKPIISAVGHETDVTLTDYAADVRAATPSAAAELAVPSQEELLQRVYHTEQRLHSLGIQRMEQLKARVNLLDASMQKNNPAQKLSLLQLRFQTLLAQLHRETANQIQFQATKLQHVIERFEQSGPMQTLKRGYTIALDDTGKPMQSVTQVKDYVRLRFYDGTARLKTISTEQEKPS
ncbi:MAG: exodeoxyribonuclease VII large subunit [Clostridiales bacterium]|nr:exodeoxyribonuclease VII large subunit [Clostridiales bacterium]